MIDDLAFMVDRERAGATKYEVLLRFVSLTDLGGLSFSCSWR
jgi:hypothetical protein